MAIVPLPYVVQNDLAAYLSAYLGAELDDNRASLVLNMAVLECQSLVNPLPDGAAAVVLDVAARAYSNPANAQTQTTGPFSVGYGAMSGGLWLTRQNQATLRRLAGAGGAFTIDTMPATAASELPWWDNGGAFYSDESPGLL